MVKNGNKDPNRQKYDYAQIPINYQFPLFQQDKHKINRKYYN